jgi:hypothetical protein
MHVRKISNSAFANHGHLRQKFPGEEPFRLGGIKRSSKGLARHPDATVVSDKPECSPGVVVSARPDPPGEIDGRTH